MLNKYGTAQNNSTAYEFQRDGIVPDMALTEHYELNGLFSKIIDAPAEEALKHGHSLGLKQSEVSQYIYDALDKLEWEEKAATAIKWSRLYGGALGVMLINDGGGIDEPLNWRRIKGIEEIRIYERAVVTPDYTSLYNYNLRDPTRSSTPRFGMPEYYQVNSIYGQFWVHESRCLIFRNGVVPERTLQPFYRFWGIPEYIRIRRELRETVTSHGTGVKMLERSVQAIYSMKDLASLLGTDEGMDIIIKRLQAIDMARGILNSIAIDNDGESYDFKTIPMAGVKDVIDTTCNMLSAVTNIPQTILFGRSPAGQNSTGKSDLENWYNYVEKIQRLMLRNNLRQLSLSQNYIK
jgi:phage-related protein (TIGR01555 family)